MAFIWRIKKSINKKSGEGFSPPAEFDDYDLATMRFLSTTLITGMSGIMDEFILSPLNIEITVFFPVFFNKAE